MAAHNIEVLGEYVKCLIRAPVELDALFFDLLIGVTRFFRDAEIFEVLREQIIPKLFEHKSDETVIRIWSAGCSNGREAYSLAILLQEYMATHGIRYTVQVFATDINFRAINTARSGFFPLSIAEELSAERLARFFTLESDGCSYRAHKSIRDMIIFAVHDVLKDPPFSKIDLISCRNLLIYLNATLQRKVISIFHYALNPGGILLLGNSEGVGSQDDLFSVLDRKAKLYRRSGSSSGIFRAFTGHGIQAQPLVDYVVDATRPEDPKLPMKRTLRELTEAAILLEFAPVGALVNDHGDMLYVHGRTGMYLEPMAGDAGVNNILKMAREGLLSSLTTALHKACETQKVIRCQHLRVRTNGHFTTVNLTVRPVPVAPLMPPLFLVLMEEAPILEALAVSSTSVGGFLSEDSSTAECIAALRQEIQDKDECLQATREELTSSTEELKSSNEEMQSINEELQSSNEELETSKEELHAVNDELNTVNAHMQARLSDLAQVNSDMNNLLAGTGIATLFVDHHLCVMRYTPSATAIINLIKSDEGRPLGHIVSNIIGYDRLLADAQIVLDTLIPIEANVQVELGNWYRLKIQPYRTIENVIEGVVISFVDISEMRRIEMRLQENRKLLAAAQHVAKIGCWEWDISSPALVVWSDEMYDVFGVKKANYQPTPGSVADMVHPEDLHLLSACEAVADQEVTLNYELEYRIITQDTKVIKFVHAWVARNLNAERKVVRLVGTIQDITERKRSEELSSAANACLLRLAVVVRDSHDAIIVQDVEGRILAWNPSAERLYGWSEPEALAMNTVDRIPNSLHGEELSKLQELSQAKTLEPYVTQRLTKSGHRVAVSIVSSALRNEAGQLYAVSTTEREMDVES